MPLRTGDMVGDYRVLDLIGSGGMGHVYKAQNVLSNRVEAMKVVLPDKSEELTERFLREIQVQASLVHPNITGLHTALRVDGQLIMIMELVEGETVKDRLERGPLRIGECLEYGRQILDALGYAHRHQVVHRDIKPANIMLSPNGQAKLMDFGLASGSFDRRLTRSGMVMGSLYYMAPEQVKGEALSTKSDLYSFGLTLYEMLTGVRGIQGDSDYAIMTAHLQVKPDAPNMFNPSVSQGLSDLVLRAVAKDPEERFASAEEFRDALEKFARSAPEPIMEAVAAKSNETVAVRAPAKPAPVTSTNITPEAPPEQPRASAIPPQKARMEVSSAAPQPKKLNVGIIAGAAAVVILAVGGIYKFASAPTSERAPTAMESSASSQSGGATPQPAATGGSPTSAPVSSTSGSPARAPSASAPPAGKPNASSVSPSNAAVAAASTGTPSVLPTQAPIAAPPEAPKPPQKSAEQTMAEEATRAWELIAASNDPAVLRSFHSKYPQSAQAAEALAKAEKLENDAAASAAARNAADATAALRKEMVAVLQRLELAYSARNMLQIRLAWPTIEEDHVMKLEQVFRESRMVSLTLEPRMDPRPTQNGGFINCRYVLAMPLKGGGPRRVEGIATVHFNRVNGALLVDAIVYHMANKSLYSPL